MTLLNILHSGGLFWVLTGIFVIAEVLLIKQAIKSHNSEFGRDNPTTGRWEHLGDKTPYTALWHFWVGIFLAVAYIVALITLISDYKGV